MFYEYKVVYISKYNRTYKYINANLLFSNELNTR